MTHIHSWQMRYSSTAVEFPQLRQLITIQSITYTKNEVSKNWLPETTDFTPDFVRYPTDAAAFVGTLKGSRQFAAELDFMLLIAPTRQMRLHLSAPLRAAANLQPSWILCSLLLLPDRCGCICRHP